MSVLVESRQKSKRKLLQIEISLKTLSSHQVELSRLRRADQGNQCFDMGYDPGFSVLWKHLEFYNYRMKNFKNKKKLQNPTSVQSCLITDEKMDKAWILPSLAVAFSKALGDALAMYLPNHIFWYYFKSKIFWMQLISFYSFLYSLHQPLSLESGDNGVCRGTVSPAKESWVEKTFSLGLMGCIYVVHSHVLV